MRRGTIGVRRAAAARPGRQLGCRAGVRGEMAISTARLVCGRMPEGFGLRFSFAGSAGAPFVGAALRCAR